MKAIYILKCCLYAVSLFVISTGAMGQAAGSESIYGGSASVKSIVAGGRSADVSESLYIGPGEHIIEGTWEVYARNVIIDSAAVVSGHGFIDFHIPSEAGGTASRTFLDGNNISDSIRVNIILHNSNGLQLQNTAFPADLTANGWSNNAASSTLYLDGNLNLAVNGADVFLDTTVAGDLRLSQSASISNYNAQRMVVTNNRLISHVVKNNTDDTASFVFPVGIADGDYTPATIKGSGMHHVSVQDYTPAMPSINYADSGMNRTWHIYRTGNAAAAGITLQHNNSTDGPDYQDAMAFITQQLSAGTWSVAAMPDYAGPGVHTNASLMTPASSTSNNAFFSKRVSRNEPLPVTLVSFKAQPRNCDVQIDWQTRSEKGLEAYQLQHSSDGDDYALLYNMAPEGDDAAYRYVHKAAGSGTHFYRLKIMDVGGAYSYSPVATAKVACANNLNINAYPNPAYNRLTVDGLDAGRPYTLRLLSMDGRVLMQQPSLGAGRVVLDVSGLATAIYYLQVQDDLQRNLVNVKITKM